MSLETRTPVAGDADGLGRVHVRAWQAAYSGGLMPDDFLSSLSAVERASMWRASLENQPRPRATRLIATVDGRGWLDDKIERRQEVLGVEVPEARLSLDLIA